MGEIVKVIKFLRDKGYESSYYYVINGVFVVKKVDSNEYNFVGDFLPSESPLNESKFSKIHLVESERVFHPISKVYINSNGLVRPLSISWNERSLRECKK